MKALLLTLFVCTGALADTAAQIEEEILQDLLRAEVQDPDPGRRAFVASQTSTPELVLPPVMSAPVKDYSAEVLLVNALVRMPAPPTYLLDAMSAERLQRATTPEQKLSAQKINNQSYEIFRGLQ